MYGILIVDDNSLVRMSLVNLISWKQHNATLVAIAHDGNEAFRLCEERLPHIVITDIKKIRRQPKLNYSEPSQIRM